jgi:endonuclease-3
MKQPTSQKKVKQEPKSDVQTLGNDSLLASKKWQSWSPYQNASPYPDFSHPTPQQCAAAHQVLTKLHQQDVQREFDDVNTPETIPFVLDAMIVAILSQATGWNNAKRAMNSMKATYGSVFAYDEIMAGGRDKLEATIRCGGLHVRKSMIIMTVLQQVQERYGKWNLDHMFGLSDEKAMKELLSFKYMGPKSASVVMGWCLKRNTFTVDTHVFRITGLWEWRPKVSTPEKTQSHLEVMIPPQFKFDLHFLFIAHGRSCPACIGGSKGDKTCTAKKEMLELLNTMGASSPS